jgi:arylsulfatase A-like enzyme
MTPNKPNILLITTDQQRFDTIAALGNEHIHTPHLDWLTDEGFTFTRCYADSPICMPSRATIMVGKHGYTTGLTGNSNNIMPMAVNPTLPGLLTQAGYQTRAQGKMHFHPMRANYGFEHMELPMDYHRERHRRGHEGLPKEHGVGENETDPVISTVDETHSLTHWTIAQSIDFIETRDETRPFFLWTSFTKPHPPFDPCANYWALYANRSVPEPAMGDWSSIVEKTPQGFLQPTYMLTNVYRSSAEKIRDMRRAYYACITQIDYQLGLLFARLRELNLLENTWIIFTSDHGDMQGDHHMGCKTVFLEGSAHVPLIVRPPAAAWDKKPHGGSRVSSLTTLADIMPTILRIAGVEVPADLDGVDLMSLTDKAAPDRTFYGSCANQMYAVIEGPLKYTWTSIGGGELLFNLSEDPYEKRNLATDEKRRGELEAMRGKMIEWMRKTNCKWLQNGKLEPGPAIRGPQEVTKWPGFHSTVFNSDVLH